MTAANTATGARAEVRRSFGWRAPTAIGGLLATFLVTVVAVRALGALDSAVFLSALVALNFGPMLGRLGLGQNVLRLIPGQPDAAERRKVAGVHLLATILLASVTAPIVAFVAAAGALGGPDHLMIIVLIVALVVLETVRLTLSDVFAAYGAVRWSVFMTHHVRSVLVLPLLAVAVAVAPTVVGLLLAYVVASAALLCAGLVRAWPIVTVRGTRPIPMVLNAIGTGTVLFATDVAAFAVGQGTVWAAAAGLPDVAAAQYATAAVLALQVTVIESLAAIAAMPVAARLWAAGERVRVVRLLSAVATLTTLVTTAGVLTLVVLGPIVLDIAYGPEMAGAYPVLVVLALGGLAKTSFGINITVLVVSGHATRAAFAALGVIVLSVPATLFALTAPDARWLAMVACCATVVLAVAQWQAARTVVRPAPRVHADVRAAWRELASARSAGDPS